MPHSLVLIMYLVSNMYLLYNSWIFVVLDLPYYYVVLLVLVSFCVCTNTPPMETSWVLLGLTCFFEVSLPTYQSYLPTYLPTHIYRYIIFLSSFSMSIIPDSGYRIPDAGFWISCFWVSLFAFVYRVSRIRLFCRLILLKLFSLHTVHTIRS